MYWKYHKECLAAWFYMVFCCEQSTMRSLIGYGLQNRGEFLLVLHSLIAKTLMQHDPFGCTQNKATFQILLNKETEVLTPFG